MFNIIIPSLNGFNFRWDYYLITYPRDRFMATDWSNTRRRRHQPRATRAAPAIGRFGGARLKRWKFTGTIWISIVYLLIFTGTIWISVVIDD